MKGIKSCKENYDKYFNKIDTNKNKTIAFKEFVRFSDGVNEIEIIPLIEKELHERGLV